MHVQPIDEEQWKSMQGKDKPEVKEESEFVNQGGVFVVLPVSLHSNDLRICQRFMLMFHSKTFQIASCLLLPDMVVV